MKDFCRLNLSAVIKLSLRRTLVQGEWQATSENATVKERKLVFYRTFHF
jgi:hypothetical protein